MDFKRITLLGFSLLFLYTLLTKEPGSPEFGLAGVLAGVMAMVYALADTIPSLIQHFKK